MNRRNFLKAGLTGAAGLASLPLMMDSLAFKIVGGFIQQARAEELGLGTEGPRYHVNLWLNGGPIRMGFDHWLKINAGDNLGTIADGNGWLRTAFTSTNGVVTGSEYKTFNYNGTLVPHLFSGQVFTGSGSLRNASDILDNMLVMRGFASNADGHDVNALLVQVPVTGLPSLQGLLADQSERLFAGVMVNGTSGSFFASNTNKAFTKSSADPNALMAPFNAGTGVATAFSLKTSQQTAYDTAMAYMKTYARSNRVGAKTLNKNLENASIKLKAGLGDIEGFWTEAVARYKTALLNTARMAAPGINDAYLDGKGEVIYGYPMSEAGVALGRNNAMFKTGTDMRDVLKNMNFSNLAEQLALAEYVLINDLSTNVGISHTGIQLDTGVFPGTVSNNTVTSFKVARWDADMDGGDTKLTTLMITNRFYAGILAGLLEFKECISKHTRLGTNKNLWNESVFQISSEFARSANPTGGTGHGYNQMVTSLYSGAIKNGPYVTGNIAYRAMGSGTVGTAAPITGYSGSTGAVPGVGVVPSSLVGLMRLNSNPWHNTAPPIISFNESTGSIINIFGKSQIVGG